LKYLYDVVKEDLSRNQRIYSDGPSLSDTMKLVKELGLNAHVRDNGSFFFRKPVKKEEIEPSKITLKDIAKILLVVGVGVGLSTMPG